MIKYKALSTKKMHILYKNIFFNYRNIICDHKRTIMIQFMTAHKLNPVYRNRTDDILIPTDHYSQMLYQLS